MGRKPCCKNKFGMMKKGSWTIEEDRKLTGIFLKYGQCRWSDVPKLAGLWRCPKSCRLRWINYLRPDVKRGPLSESEERVVISLHSKLGNKWSQIASHLPGRTDNEIKNIWNTTLRKKLIRKEIDYQAQKSFSISFCSSDKKKDEFADHQSEGNSQSWVTSSVHTNSSRSSSGGDSGLSHEFQMEFPGLDFDDHRVVNHVLPTGKRSDDDQEILKSSPNQSNSSEYDKVDRNSPESSQYLSNVDIDWDSFIDELDQLIPEFSLI